MLGERAELAGGAGLDEDVAQRGRLDGAGDDLAARDVGGQPAQQLVARAAADHVDARDVAARDRLEPLEHEAVLAGERDEDAPHGLAAVGGARCPARSQAAAIRAGMSPGARNALVVGVEERRRRPARSAASRCSSA